MVYEGGCCERFLGFCGFGGEKRLIISQVSISPLGKDVSVSRYVRRAVDVFKESGLRFEVNAMSTVVETETLDDLFDVVKRAHLAVLNEGAKRVITEIKIDDRVDKAATMRSKVRSVRG